MLRAVFTEEVNVDLFLDRAVWYMRQHCPTHHTETALAGSRFNLAGLVWYYQ